MTTTSPTVLRRSLAIQLRKLREASGLTGEQVASQLDWADSKISRIETAKSGVQPADLRHLMDIYGITDPDEREALLQVARDSKKKGWWQKFNDVLPDWFQLYVGLEGGAAEIQTYETEIIPGLLQTPDYARAVTEATLVKADAGLIARAVELRMARQHAITRADDPADLWAIVSEAALQRIAGTAKVQRQQLEHMVKLAERPNITIQVLPMSAGVTPAWNGPFVILAFGAGDGVVYLENLTSSLFLEEPVDTKAYSVMFDHLRGAAIAPPQSIEHIAEAAHQL